MIELKQKLLKLKLNILKLEIFREKSAVEKMMLRKHEPQRVKNAAAVIVRRKNNDRV